LGPFPPEAVVPLDNTKTSSLESADEDDDIEQELDWPLLGPLAHISIATGEQDGQYTLTSRARSLGWTLNPFLNILFPPQCDLCGFQSASVYGLFSDSPRDKPVLTNRGLEVLSETGHVSLDNSGNAEWMEKYENGLYIISITDFPPGDWANSLNEDVPSFSVPIAAHLGNPQHTMLTAQGEALGWTVLTDQDGHVELAPPECSIRVYEEAEMVEEEEEEEEKAIVEEELVNAEVEQVQENHLEQADSDGINAPADSQLEEGVGSVSEEA